MGFTIFVVVLLLLVIITLFAGIKSVPQGNEWTQERFGKFQRTLKPGLNLIIPYIDQIGRKVNMMEQVFDVPSQEIITKDNALVTVDAVVFYQVLDAAKASYEVRNLEQAVLNLTMTNIRTVTGSMDLDELLSNRDTINAKLLVVVDEATEPWGVKVTRIEVKDIKPPADLVASMARQMKAEREKRANILDAEGFRQAAILKADGEKQAAVLKAEGEKQAAFMEAEARERRAQAEAEATRVVSQAIAGGNVQAVNYFIAQQYVEALRDVASAPNQKTLILPIEATSILGSLQGIAEVAKEAFGPGQSQPAQMPPMPQMPRQPQPVQPVPVSSPVPVGAVPPKRQG
ncbi:SPFH domain-containing protein [Deinococcus wulumuqiensis]|uniref:Paraslipin n=1 Tax=Deinococcus wulumuqiensis TaxID=980427 RepID=A0A345IE00_9DEIO|nr:SPFH domain-containing protein [Deinococcus wulumuqiensis]AXG97922.1 SPFH/Band 7/PHB domain protein [Deinococcus wulumuqiensis]QII19418.1 SPFH/Band 7/PHB domain protein [Deinococcus wulumuqiensis R12]GGI76835.1 paraslipin [Deinococcus wulumuqiensis]GGP29291.1 paraslipin [Deinococcus wulumuqiensis]